MNMNLNYYKYAKKSEWHRIPRTSFLTLFKVCCCSLVLSILLLHSPIGRLVLLGPCISCEIRASQEGPDEPTSVPERGESVFYALLPESKFGPMVGKGNVLWKTDRQDDNFGDYAFRQLPRS